MLGDAVLIRLSTNAVLDLKAVAVRSGVVRTLPRDRAAMRFARRRLMLHDISGYRRELIEAPQRICVGPAPRDKVQGCGNDDQPDRHLEFFTS